MLFLRGLAHTAIMYRHSSILRPQAAKMSDSCDFGAQQACRNLGMCYQWGKGTAPDLLHARSMYGFVKMDREYPTMGEALEAWTGADGGRAAYLEEEDFKGYFAHRFPQSLRMIPQADLQRFLQVNPGIQNGEELYLLKTVNKREQLLGKAGHCIYCGNKYEDLRCDCQWPGTVVCELEYSLPVFERGGPWRLSCRQGRLSDCRGSG